MKIYYFNDETHDMRVFYNIGLTGDPAILKPAEGATFDVVIPEGCIPFIKKWNDYIMISYTQEIQSDPLYEGTGKYPWEEQNQ